MVRKVTKIEASDYLKKAEEFLSSAQDNLTKGRFNAAGFEATQSIINANDALTIYFLEQRASKDHKEAVKLHVDVVRVINDGSGRQILKNALEARSEVGYLGRAITQGEAQNLVKSAIKFIEWVKRYLK
jgi:HEPN domain-containing protein